MNELKVYCGDSTRHNGCVPGRLIGGRFTQFSPRFSYDLLAAKNWRTGRQKTDPPLLPGWKRRLEWITTEEDYWHAEDLFADWYRSALLSAVKDTLDMRVSWWTHLFPAGREYSEGIILAVAGEEVFLKFSQNFRKASLEDQQRIFADFTNPVIRSDASDIKKKHLASWVAQESTSEGAARWLIYATGLTAAERTMLMAKVADSYDAVEVLVYAPSLTEADRTALVRLVTGGWGRDAWWVLRYAPGLTDDHRAILERVANQ